VREVEFFYDCSQACLGRQNMAFHIKLEFSDKGRINYDFLKCKKIQKTKQLKSQSRNQILSWFFFRYLYKNT